MKKYLPLLLNSPLFAGIREEELPELLSCLGARTAACRRQGVLLLEGQPVDKVGLVLSGRVQIMREDLGGNRTILAEAGPGELFAEAFACARARESPVTVTAASDGEVLWLDYRKVVSVCPSACPFHNRLVENMLSVLASKNILLGRKIRHISGRSIREKLLSYLSDQAAERGGREFDIPFSRQELADYLCADRSALSAELSRMRKDGILRYHLRHFELLRAEKA